MRILPISSGDVNIFIYRISSFDIYHLYWSYFNENTFEFTKESDLSKQGDCIIGVKSTKAATDLSFYFKEAARKKGAQITILIEVEELKEIIKAKGDPKLLFSHPTDLVVRKSNYICKRTLAIKADKAAVDFSRKIIEKLKNHNQIFKITLTIDYWILASTTTCQVYGATSRTVLTHTKSSIFLLFWFTAFFNWTFAFFNGFESFTKQ